MGSHYFAEKIDNQKHNPKLQRFTPKKHNPNLMPSIMKLQFKS